MKRWSLIILFWAVGCSGSPDKDPVEVSLQQSKQRVASGHESAFESADGLDIYDVRLRYNPARCDCPKNEIHMYGRWVRAYLTGAPTELSRIQRFGQEVQQGNARSELSVRGRLTTTKRRSARRIEFPVFELAQ